WFVRQMKEIVDEYQALKSSGVDNPAVMRRAKEMGFSDHQLARLWNKTDEAVRAIRKKHGILPCFRLVDTCAAEFEAYTPYYYSSYGDEDEFAGTDKERIVILGGGPNRIGQGIEFDYCCVHAAFALKDD